VRERVLYRRGRDTDTVFIIGIAGGSGSGKTALAQQLLKELGEERAVIIEHDSYYKDRSLICPDEAEKINYDHPDALDTQLLIEHLIYLKNRERVYRPVYDFSTHKRIGEGILITPKDIIILEGILILAERKLRELLGLKVFIDADSDIRFIRRLRRDMSERGRTADSVIAQYEATVRPMHLEFVEPSKKYADIVVSAEGSIATAIEETAKKYQEKTCEVRRQI